jgi:predicted ATPase
MHASLAAFVAEHSELTRPVELRVGINSGEVLFGRVSGTDDYTVMGDVVNVASRLEALAPPNGIYVGDSTAALTSPTIILEPVDVFDVRGREQREMVWQVLGIEQQRSGFSVRRDTPFVGRSSQREHFAGAIAHASAGTSAIVALIGEAGSGKTRLIAEMLDTVGDDTIVLAGTCAPFGETNPWAPIATAMFGQLDPVTTSSASRMRTLSIENAISVFGFDGEDPLLGWLAEAALHIAGHPSAFDQVPRARARDTLFRLIVEALRRRSAQGPVILCIDDLQWADNLLIEVLHRIGRSLTDRPFLLVTAQRSDVEVDWPPAPDGSVDGAAPTTLHLEPLTPAEAGDLVEALTGDGDAPFLAQLYERSGGNPLFLTELANLATSDDTQRELPSSLRVLIASRLDRLSAPARAVLDNAAVLGVSGFVDSLETFASELGQPFAPDTLETLDDAGLLELTTPTAWRFRSDVVREVAYETLTKADRAERHAGVALIMASSPGVPIGSLAHHAARAAELNLEIGPIETIPKDMASRAVALLGRAAQRSLEVGAFRQARRDTERALALGPEDPTTLRRLLLVRATAATELREFDAAGDDGRAALESAIEHCDRHDEGTARRLIGVQAHGLGDLPTARHELDYSIAIFRELDNDADLAISLADRGFCEIFGGSLADAERLLNESEALAVRLGDRRSAAWAGQHKALVAFLSGGTDLAAERLDAAIALFEELGDRSGLIWAQAIKAYLAYYGRRLDDAEALAIDARAEARKLGERWAPAMMDALIASIRLWTGNFAEAEALSRQSLVTFRELGDRFGIVQSLAPHVRSLVALGKFAEAERGIEEALALSETSGTMAAPAMVAAGAAVHLGLGERSLVIAELALERIEETGADGSEVRTALALALCQVGRADEALGRLLGANPRFPYTRSVRALAFALIADGPSSLEDADLVVADPGATYLDRVIADVAASVVEAGRGNHQMASQRLARVLDIAESAGDVVAVSLTNAVAARILKKPDEWSALLGVGWRRVLDDLMLVHQPNPDG